MDKTIAYMGLQRSHKQRATTTACTSCPDHSAQYPSEGFPRLAYLGPGAGWDGGREDFEDSRRSGVSIRAQGPWAQGPRARGPRAQGPWAQESANKRKSRQQKLKKSSKSLRSS